MSTTMRAIRLHETAGPEKLVVDTVPVPEPRPGEIRVRLRAAAFNRRDVFITQGLYPNIALPRILGSDGAGTVEKIGDGDARFTIGDEVVIDPMIGWGDDARVWGTESSILGMPLDGTFAEYVCVPAENVYPKPSALTMEEAAAIPLAGLTAYRATFTRGELHAGETILVPGVGGGVQTFVLLFAKAAGARTIVTSGTDQKLARARELGADVTLDYRVADWHKAAKKHGPVDLAVDSSGGDTLAKAISVVRPGGRIVIYGGTRPGATIKLFPVFWNHLDIRGTSMGSPTDFSAMLARFDGTLKPAIDRVYRFDEAVGAAKRMAGGEQFGKIVLTID